MRQRNVNQAKRLTYGFIAPYIWGDLSLNYLKGAVRGAEVHDVNLICVLGQTPKDPENHNASANIAYELVNKRLRDGLIIWASHFGQFLTKNELAEFYQKFSGIPLVSLSEVVEDKPAVVMDNCNGIIMLIDHLVEVHGYSKIGFIRGPEYHRYSEERLTGYLEGFKKHNIPVDPQLITKPRLISEGSGVDAIQYYFDELKLRIKTDLEAIICVSDSVALGAATELNRRGMKIPQDIAIVGFNNKNESRMCHPPLTTIDPQLPLYGEHAINILQDLRQGKKISGRQYIKNKLVVRGSCGCHTAINDSTEHNKTHRTTLHLINEAERTNIIEELKTVAENFIRLSQENWVKQLIDSFFINISNPDSTAFISCLNELLDELSENEGDSVGNFNVLLTEMRHQILPHLNTTELMNRGFELWDQARLLVTRTIEYLDADYKTKIDRLLISLHTTNQTLMTSYNLDELKLVIEDLLKRLSIPGCYISLYENPTEPLESAELIFAVIDNKRIDLNNIETIFEPADLVPADILPSDRRYTMILHPLYYQDMQLGFALFETGPLDKAIYQILCSEISNALHRVMIFEELKHSEKERTKLLETLSNKNLELEKKIQERTADIRMVNQQLQLAIDQANAANVAKSRFLANISHEIRTPLNSIIGFAEVLNSTRNEEKHAAYVNLIINESERLVELINQILDLSKIEANKLSLDLEHFNIRELLKSLTSVYSTIAEKKGLEYSCKMDSSVPDTLIGDPLRLRQILVNLIGNAIKFTSKGKIKISIEQIAETSDKLTLLFRIKDTGIGIPKERQDTIFDAFVQAEDSITRRFGGTGLGVSISKQLVLLMDGEIGLDSEVDKGSCFWFTAVFAKAAPKNQFIEQSIEFDEFNIPDAVKGSHILLVEDYPINRTLVQSHLKTLECEVSVAENGQIAVDMFKQNRYDLILMDVQMPALDGCEATKIIRALPKGNDIPIIGLTANAFEYDIAKYLHVGMNDIITKPFRKNQLLQKICYWITKKHSFKEKKTYSAKKAIDFDDLLQEFDGDTDFLINLIHEFIVSAKNHISLLKNAVATENSASIVENAHRIKGAALNLSANSFAELAAALEKQGAADDLANAKLTLDLLERELKKLEDSITKIHDSLSSN